MRRNQKDSWRRKRLEISIKSFMKLNQLDHESVVWAGNSPLLLDETFGGFIVVTVHVDEVGDDEGDRPRYSLDAVNENVLFLSVCSVYVVNHPVK